MPILSNFPSGAKQENASATVAGVAKLYTATGTSTDGAMTQKAVTDALSGKAASSHTHDDRYFTESEMNTKLSSKSDTAHKHDDTYLKLAGGALTGDLTVGSSQMQTNGYITGTWLRTTDAGALSSAAARFAVLDGSGWVYYRTKDQLLSDLGLTGVKTYTIIDKDSVTPDSLIELWESGSLPAIVIDDILYPLVYHYFEGDPRFVFATVSDTSQIAYYIYDLDSESWSHGVTNLASIKYVQSSIADAIGNAIAASY